MTNEKNIITSLSKCDFYPDEPVFQSPVRSLATDEQGRETENQKKKVRVPSSHTPLDTLFDGGLLVPQSRGHSFQTEL